MVKFLFPLFLIIFWVTDSRAQVVDSLLRILPSAKGGKLFDVLFGIAYEYSDVNDSLSFIYADKALTQALTIKDSARILRGARIKQGESRRLGNYDEAQVLAQYAYQLSLRMRDTAEIKLLASANAILMERIGSYDKAIEYYLIGLSIAKKQNDKFWIAQVCHNLGVVYLSLQYFDKALDYSFEALKIKNEIKNSYDYDLLLSNIAVIYHSSGDFLKSKEYAEKTLSACKLNCSDRIMATIWVLKGYRYMELKKNYDSAILCFRQAIDHSKGRVFPDKLLEALYNEALAYMYKNDFQEALGFLDEYERLALHFKSRRRIYYCYKGKQELYRKTGNTNLESFYKEKCIKYRDSIYGENAIKKIEMFHARQIKLDLYPVNENERTAITGNIFYGTAAVVMLASIFSTISFLQRRKLKLLFEIRSKIKDADPSLYFKVESSFSLTEGKSIADISLIVDKLYDGV